MFYDDKICSQGSPTSSHTNKVFTECEGIKRRGHRMAKPKVNDFVPSKSHILINFACVCSDPWFLSQKNHHVLLIECRNYTQPHRCQEPAFVVRLFGLTRLLTRCDHDPLQHPLRQRDCAAHVPPRGSRLPIELRFQQISHGLAGAS